MADFLDFIDDDDDDDESEQEQGQGTVNGNNAQLLASRPSSCGVSKTCLLKTKYKTCLVKTKYNISYLTM